MKKVIFTSKRISILLFAVLLACASTVCVFAESNSKLNDNAALYKTNEKNEITEWLENESIITDWDIIINTNKDDVDSDDMRDTCNKYYDSHNYGKGGKKSGVMLTIDMGSREMYILTKGDAMYYFSDDRIDKMKNDVIDSLHSDDYYSAASLFITYVDEYYSKGKPKDTEFSNLKLVEKDQNLFLYVLKYYGVIIGIIAVAISLGVVLTMLLKYRNNGKKGTYSLYDNSKTKITNRQDVFIRKSVTVTHRSSSDSGSDSSGSSDSSCGGGGGSF